MFGTLAWTIFVLQDSVLAGIRQAGWVPIENGVFSVAKIILLVPLAQVAPTIGVFLAWTAPLLALIVPVNLLLFGRLIPRHVHETRDRPPGRPAGRIAGYVAADYLAYMMWAATIGALPIIVLSVAGAEANAHFFVAWSIAYALYLVSSGMSMSLLAEASLDPRRLADHARRTAMRDRAPRRPGGRRGRARRAAAAAAARLELRRRRHAAAAAGAVGDPARRRGGLRHLARVRRQMRAVVVTYGALCAIVLGLGLVLLSRHGIEGLGVAWLAAQVPSRWRSWPDAARAGCAGAPATSSRRCRAPRGGRAAAAGRPRRGAGCAPCCERRARPR